MTAALLAGLLAGYSVAMPVGPMATYLVALSARTSVRVGAAAALGIATVDGGYAVAATLGGAAVADLVRPALGVLHWVSVVVLAGLAGRAVWPGLTPMSAARPTGTRPALRPARAYLTLAGLTAVNPTTLLYFVALVVGLRTGGSAPSLLGQALFVAAAFAASASWQLLLACGGAVLGRVLTGVRGRRWTALVSGALIAVLALRLAIS